MKNNEVKAINSLKPIRTYRQPEYPGKELFIQYPELFLEAIPSSWRGKIAVTTALLAFIFGNCTYSVRKEKRHEPSLQGQTHSQSDVQKAKNSSEAKTRNKPALIAPLFIHGEGVGATGCVVMTPPVFLSEAEALQLIHQEFEKAQLSFNKKNQLIPEIYSIDELDKVYLDKGKLSADYITKLPFFFDFFSSKYNFGVKFISKYNHSDFAGIRSFAQDKAEKKVLPDHTEDNLWHMDGGSIEGGFTGSSVQSYNMIASGQIIREFFRNQDRVGTVVFYDPMVSSDVSIRFNYKPNERSKIKETSKQLLCKQVAEFITWFKINYPQSKAEKKVK